MAFNHIVMWDAVETSHTLIFGGGGSKGGSKGGLQKMDSFRRNFLEIEIKESVMKKGDKKYKANAYRRRNQLSRIMMNGTRYTGI